MEVKIGVVYSHRELSVDVDGSVDEVAKVIEQALGDDDGVLWLTDTRGRRIGVPVGKLAYVELGAEDGSKRVGFGG